jgi:Tfp pilus assembly protein PilO
MAINKRERTLLILTVVFVVVGLNYLLVAPLWGRWETLGRDLSKQRRELQAIKETIARKPTWQARYDDLRHDLKQSQQYDTISDVLKKLDEVSGNAGVLMQSKQSLKATETDVSREWPVSCRFEATIESLVKFLHGLQTGSGFMTVESLQVTSKPDNASILRCDMQIRALAAKGDRPAS